MTLSGESREAPRRIVLAINPRVLSTAPVALARAVREGFAGALADGGVVETRADPENSRRIAGRVVAAGADLLVAAGGDGTVGDAANALAGLAPPYRPPLAILPFGTANNVARSLGLRSIRDADSLDFARAAALRGKDRPFDLGRAGDRFFAGSLALGMDADILSLRNAVRSWTGDVPPLTGYPLYLASCATNLLLPHGGPARVEAGRFRQDHPGLYGALVLNVALYAGEFRFAAGDPSRDGSLDLHAFGGAVEYVAAYTGAWRRQLAHGRGEGIGHPSSRRRVRTVSLRFRRPVAAQLDGEELPPAEDWDVGVVPGALTVRVPRLRRPDRPR